MRLVVIDTQKATYDVYEGRSLVARYHSTDGQLIDARQIEVVRTAEPPPMPKEST